MGVALWAGPSASLKSAEAVLTLRTHP